MRNYQRIDDIEDCRKVMQEVLGEYMAENEEDDDRMRAIKRTIATLPAEDQVLFILHTEVGSYRQLAKVFGVGKTTINNRIQLIKQKIKNNLKK